MADEKTVTVALKRTYRKGANSYGPGEAVEMPESLANALGLSPEKQAARAEKKAAKSKKKSK